MSIILTADSTCDLSPELVKKNGVVIMPLYTVLDSKSYRDGVDITPDEIYAFVKEKSMLPKTSAGSVDDYITLFKKYVDDGNEVVHLSISSKMSSSYQNACIAAGEIGNVYVVDTANISTGSGLLVLDAADMVKEGLTAKEIAEKLNVNARLVRASFVTDTLEYLHMGGRCSSVAALGANLLKIKPRIEVNDGAMGMGGKYRGQFEKVLATYVKDVLSKDNIKLNRVFVTHTKCDTAVVQNVIEAVKNTLDFENVYETTAGCVITSHCGPNTLGVLFEVEN